MRKSILIGLSIITVAGILLAAFALGFGDTRTKVNAFKSAETEKNTSGSSAIIEPKNESKTNSQFRSIEFSEKGAIQYAQSNVSFRIIEPLYILAGYNFESAEGKKFTGVANDIDMASFSYKNGDEQLIEADLTALEGDEKKLVKEIADHGGEMLQNQLVLSLNFSKAKVSRMLTDLEKRGLVVKKQYGLTNKFALADKLRGEKNEK
jgi:uncharacterized membrane protein